MAATSELEDESFKVESTIRGRHNIGYLDPVLGQNLDVQPERDNSFMLML